MGKQMSYKWCRACNGHTLHVSSRCNGCASRKRKGLDANKPKTFRPTVSKTGGAKDRGDR